MTTRAEHLANRLRQGADALADYAERLDESQWTAVVPTDGRSVGVVIHHVASSYPIEIQLARTLAGGSAITGVTSAVIDKGNAGHAADHRAVDRSATVKLLRANAASAAAAVAGFSDAELDTAAPVSLYADAPLTTQFFIEDHALRHSFHHLGRIRQALEG